MEVFFRDYTYTWWQIGVFKVGLLSAGILLGLYFTPTLKKYRNLFWIVALVGLVYITFISLSWFTV